MRQGLRPPCRPLHHNMAAWENVVFMADSADTTVQPEEFVVPDGASDAGARAARRWPRPADRAAPDPLLSSAQCSSFQTHVMHCMTS